MSEYLLDKLDSNADRRVRKTKKALRSALFNLIESKKINQITVKEITDIADVNRSTFYLYYTDVYDMYESIQDEIYTVFAQEVIPNNTDLQNPDDFVNYCARFLKFCKQNQQTCKFIFRNETNNEIAHRIKLAIQATAPDSHKAFPLEDPRHYLTTYAIYGITFTIIEWVRNGMQCAEEDMAVFLAYTYVCGSQIQKDSEFYRNYLFYKNKE